MDVLPALTALRALSRRPELLVDQRNNFIQAPATSTYVGMGGPLGRQRLVTALPLEGGPRQLEPAEVVHDADLAYLADPNGSLIGFPAVRVSRLLEARWVLDTRRLG